jgi:hypothetical protein
MKHVHEMLEEARLPLAYQIPGAAVEAKKC